MTSKLTCKELVELVTDYLQGSLPASERLRFEQHIAICPGCRTYVAQMRQTIRLLGRLTEKDIPEGAKRRLLQAFSHWKD